MTVGSTYTPAKYTGNSSTLDFTYSFPIGVATYLEVYLEVISTGVQTLQTQGSDYTLVFDETGGTVSFVSAPTDLQYVIISRNVAFEQQVSLTTSKVFDPKVIEGALDKLTEQTQQLKEFDTRVPSLPLGSTLTNVSIPTPSAGKALLWNATADGLENSTDDFNDIVTDATAQAGIATAQAGLADTARAAAQTAQGLAETAQGLAEDWASKTDGQVDSTDYSSKAYAIGGTGVTSAIGASKEWAITAEDTEVTTGNYSALHHAAKAAASALAAQVAKIEWQGTWSAGTYQANDAVEKDGTSYIATTTTTETPSVTATDWDVLALKGTDGTGDVSTDATSSVDSELALYDSTTGKKIKRCTLSGIAKMTSGVVSAATANDIPNPMTTRGDLLYYNGTNWDRLEKGTAGQVLTQGANDPSWATPGGGSGKVVGEVFWFAGSSVPEYCLECDGAAISRTTYADLFTAIGTTWGVGDGSTTFNIPNAKTAGRFLRSRTASVALGTAQDGAYLNHSHTASSNSTGSHSHSAPGGTTPGGGNYFQVATVSYSSVSTSSAGNHSHTITVDTSSTGGTETRPTNLSMILCIKY